MTLQEAIVARHSVRAYKDKPLSDEVVKVLEDEIVKLNRRSNEYHLISLGNGRVATEEGETNDEGQLHIQLICNEPRAFQGTLAKYGKFRNVTSYIVMAGKKPDGTSLTAENYLDYLKSEIIRSAQIAKNAGADIPDSLGFKFTSEAGGMFAAPINGGMRPQMQDDKHPMMQGGQPPMGMRPMRGGKRQVGEYVTDLDMQKYLNYVVSTQALKGVPAFDSQIDGINNASGENEEFGDGTGSSVNFTDYTAQKNNTMLTDAIRQNVRLLNPMSFIGDRKTTVAPHWYIRHGARDRDTAFPVPVNFATKLQNAGKNVNFLLAWNRPHSGDYALDELFAWIADIVKK